MTDVLDRSARRKLDSGDDTEFYAHPRLVHHIDEAFRARLTRLYRERLPAGGRLLDLMSAHVSHLPSDVEFERVVGHGMNREELTANPRLDDSLIRDLNADQSLPFPEDAFDAVTIAVSVQYLQYPEAVFEDLARVLASGGVLVVSFSNRMFPTKAIRAWREASMDERADLIGRYLDVAGGFDDPEVIRERPGNDPFYAVCTQRSDYR
jgi:SAM-dependent methyltransferase